jgi:Tropinone reductase 1
MLLFGFVLLFIVVCISADETSTPSRWNLLGKNVVVTGGSKGIGKAIVEEVGVLGAKVLTCGRDLEELKSCKQHWDENGIQSYYCVADVSTDVGRNVLFDEAEKLFGEKIDCLINNVGTNIRKKAFEYSDEEYKKVMDTNLDSAFFLTKKFYPLLKASKKGSVVHIGSVAGLFRTLRLNNFFINFSSIYLFQKVVVLSQCELVLFMQ